MSFSSEIKEKLCSAHYECNACAGAELCGALFFGGTVTDDAVRFSTENERVAVRVKSDIYAAFGIDAYVTGDKIKRIAVSDVYEVENMTDELASPEIPFACCRASFVRGAFLGGGSVTDPRKGYHMEFDTREEKYAVMLREMLLEAGFNAKITNRKGYYIVYIKDSEEIADLIGYMGAAASALELFSVQIEKDMRNNVNRRVNCENANTDKAAAAASKHLYAIKKIRAAGKWALLSETLRETALLREEFPEDSLKELGERVNPPIGKSGINHRLEKILKIAESV